MEQTNPPSSISDGRIVPFPLTRRTRNVRRCAEELDNLHGEQAVLYWRTQCRMLADELLSLGCCDAEMRRQVREFQDEVQAELVRCARKSAP